MVVSPVPRGLLPEWHALYCQLMDEVHARRGHPDPNQAGDADRFEVQGPHGSRFSIASSQMDYTFYVYDGNAWLEIEDLKQCITRFSDDQQGPSPQAGALESLRAAKTIIHAAVMQLRAVPPESPDFMAAQVFQEMQAISNLLQREMTANVRRAQNLPDDSSDDDFAPSSSSDSDTSFGSLDSGDHAVME